MLRFDHGASGRSGCRISTRVQGFRFLGDQGLGRRLAGFGLGFRVSGLGFRV